MITTANSSVTFQIRLYRDSTLISTKELDRTLSTAQTALYPVSNTYVDTAIATGTSTYQLRVIFTATNNITSATAVNRDINCITF